MSSQKLCMIPVLLGVALVIGATEARGQYPGAPGGYGPQSPPMVAGNPYGPGGGVGPGMYPVAPTALYGPDGTIIEPIPASDDPGGQGPPGAVYGGEYGGEYEGEYMDGEYADSFHPGHHILGLILPYAEGGLCAPRWFDLRAEAVQMRREKVSRQMDFTSDGILGPIVLSSDSLNFDPEWGFRAVAALQVGAGSNIEFNYLGAFNFASAAAASSPTDNLFSVFSDFGADPFLGFGETDRSYYQNIAYSSNLNSYELSFRRRWEGRNCRLQGSWLAGIRYLQVVEDFDYRTRSNVLNPQTLLTEQYSLDYAVGTNNSLTGFQVGGDAWITVIPGFSFGGELKAGIYGNHAHQNTLIQATTLAGGFYETTAGDDAAFVGEANLMAIYRINYNWTFRAGYNLMFVDGLALAIENFNTSPPALSNPTLVPDRVPFFNDNGNIFYHGWSAGVEWLW